MSKRKKYQWRKGARGLSNLDADKIGSEIDYMIDNNIPHDPEGIVEYARQNEDSELHKGFEWDDTKAAENYRIEQARYITRHIIHIVNNPNAEVEEEREPEVRVFFQIGNKTEYKRTVEIHRNEDEYAALLAKAMSELRAFKRKYSTLVELEEIFKLID